MMRTTCFDLGTVDWEGSGDGAGEGDGKGLGVGVGGVGSGVGFEEAGGVEFEGGFTG